VMRAAGGIGVSREVGGSELRLPRAVNVSRARLASSDAAHHAG